MLQLFSRNELSHQAHFCNLLALISPAGKKHFSSFGRTQRLNKLRQAFSAVHHAQFGRRHSHGNMVGGNTNIAAQSHVQCTAKAVAIEHGDSRIREVFDGGQTPL